jgi:UDP-galactopyranose mutase
MSNRDQYDGNEYEQCNDDVLLLIHRYGPH